MLRGVSERWGGGANGGPGASFFVADGAPFPHEGVFLVGRACPHTGRGVRFAAVLKLITRPKAYSMLWASIVALTFDSDAKPLRTSLKWFQHFAESP
jgi:hypothetical protein